VWLDPYNFALPSYLNRTNDVVSTDRDNETHGTMLRNCRINLEKYAAEAYVIADSPELRNRASKVNLQVNRIT
jgi:hypothetical protein